GVDAGSPPPWEQADRPSTAADDTAISRRDSTSSSLDLTGYSGFVGVLVVAESCFQLLDLVGEALDAFIYGVAEASRVVMGPPGQLVGHLLADLVLPRGGNCGPQAERTVPDLHQLCPSFLVLLDQARARLDVDRERRLLDSTAGVDVGVDHGHPGSDSTCHWSVHRRGGR